MCIIVVKCKGADFAPKETIARCMETNPHGFSVAWNADGKVHTFRTMNPSEMMTRYEELVATLDPLQTSMLFHARIATHGSHRVENTHCFTYGEPAELAFCHNGVLHNIQNRDDLTDSETYFRDFFIPAMEGCGSEFAFKMSKALISSSNNKFAFLDKDGKVTLVYGINGFVKEQFPGLRGKIYFSNTSFRPALTFGLGFNPYADVKKPDTKKSEATAKTSGGSLLPSVGQRKQAGPPHPLSLSAIVGDTFEERYQAVLGHHKA